MKTLKNMKVFAGLTATILLANFLTIAFAQQADAAVVTTTVVDVDFTTPIVASNTIFNYAPAKLTDLDIHGSPSFQSDGLKFNNTVSSNTDQYLTGNLGTTTNMSKIIIEVSGKFTDSGCAANNSGSMLFSLQSGSLIYYNIYRHSNFIGFNTFWSENYGIAIPQDGAFHTYKFVMVPNSQSYSNQEIWLDGVQQTLAYRNSNTVVDCGNLNGVGENSPERRFASGSGDNGNFLFMTHAYNPTTWGTTGTIANLKITTVVTTAGATTPDAPTIGSITAGNGQLSVPFTAPTSDGGVTITDYEYSLNSGAWTSAASTSSPIVITGLTNGTSYGVKLRAKNSQGGGTASSEVSATPVAPTQNNNSSSRPSTPSAPPASVESIELTPAKGAKGSIMKLKLDAGIGSGAAGTVKIKIYDLKGKLIQELNLPVTGDASVIEVPVNLSIGEFTVEASSLNGAGATAPVATKPTFVERSFLEPTSGNSAPKLLGQKVSAPIYFAADSAKLTATAKIALLKLVAKLKSSKSRIALTGFTAAFSRGKTAEKRLAQARALAVAK